MKRNVIELLDSSKEDLEDINNIVLFVKFLLNIPIQGIDGSARKPALVQDTNYMVEKTYQIAQYLGAFGAYLMPQ